MSNNVSAHGMWSSRWVFILAATGSAVGIGNIWKFPYVAGENGGGAFVLVYLACIALIGIPVMMSEIMIGRHGRQSPINTMLAVARDSGRSSLWSLIGWMGVVAGFLILSYYSVIAGWAMAYIPYSMSGMFTDASPEAIGNIFNNLVGNVWLLLMWHTIFMGVVIFVIARGVQNGLEKAVKLLMPALFILLFAMVVYAAFATGQFAAGLKFLFTPDFGKLFYPDGTNFSGQGVLTAMGLAFFSLSIGMGAIMMYGAYLPKGASVSSTAITIAGADSLVAILAGMAIFPIVFANGLSPGQGPGLVFQTLPIAFGQMPGGAFWGALFFLLLVFAAWTSAFSLLEPVVAWLVENRGMKRSVTAFLCGGATWLLGLLTVFSFNIWADVRPLGFLTDTVFAGQTFFDFIDYVTQNVMLPIGGLFIVMFAAWFIARGIRDEELDVTNEPLMFNIWLFLVRYVAPVGIILVTLNAIGLFA
ncbi:MAG: sodium-dependent transporter [Pseudomonadota bacterium]